VFIAIKTQLLYIGLTLVYKWNKASYSRTRKWRTKWQGWKDGIRKPYQLHASRICIFQRCDMVCHFPGPAFSSSCIFSRPDWNVVQENYRSLKPIMLLDVKDSLLY